MPKSNINPELEGKYKLKTHFTGLHTSIGKVEFGTMTAEQADQLCEIAPEYIEKVKASKSNKPV